MPVVVGSDKTTVSVATGHQEYHPVYMSPGNLTNIARQAHGNALIAVAFLPIPKSRFSCSPCATLSDMFAATKKPRKTTEYQKFAQQLYHTSLACVLNPLKAGMTTPEVIKCPDGHLCLSAWALYCGLSQISVAGCNCSRLVS